MLIKVERQNEKDIEISKTNEFILNCISFHQPARNFAAALLRQFSYKHTNL